MPLTATKQAANAARRQLQRACEEIRRDWTRAELRSRQDEASLRQLLLAATMGLRPQPAMALATRRAPR